jgi:hypothetical protein
MNNTHSSWQANTQTGSVVDTKETASHLARLELLSTWLDRYFVDPIVGFLIPGAGDSLCSLFGLYGVFVAIQLKVHPVVISRMLINLAVDAVLGSIPILGAVFDVFYRAHIKNLDLIKQRGSYGEPTVGDWFIVGGAGLLLIVALLLPVIVVGLLIAWLWTLL